MSALILQPPEEVPHTEERLREGFAWEIAYEAHAVAELHPGSPGIDAPFGGMFVVVVELPEVAASQDVVEDDAASLLVGFVDEEFFG